MSFKIKLLNSARNDIHEIIDWYSGKEKRLGDRFYQALKSAMEYIKRNPYNCQIAYRDVRNKPLGKFPYQVHYCIEEPDKTLIDFAVTHTSRNPRIWTERR